VAIEIVAHPLTYQRLLIFRACLAFLAAGIAIQWLGAWEIEGHPNEGEILVGADDIALVPVHLSMLFVFLTIFPAKRMLLTV
jgi:hypothetical protein